ncbi:MAG: MerR family transcriptional regulator [Novosphingobium sp.]|uniref:MerR family transcriptional regulator n=1 Tax=Novosphingobium sp. TaxID=1874826 RepID=UPI001831EC43|nr:MerR family transcriptional regulator [Novosphingobium sp.]
MSGEGLLDRTAQGASFADGKEPGALRTIGEVAKALGIRQHVLRYWEEQFPMLRPLKRSGGRRYYRAEDVQLVETIDRLVHREGYTLKGAKKALSNGGGTHGSDAAPQPVAISAPLPSGAAPAPSFAYRARLIALRTTLVTALHEA